MTDHSAVLSAAEATRFLTDKSVQVFDPETGRQVATARYEQSGLCEAMFIDGQTDCGRWGQTQTGYWTQYSTFREGTRNAFVLVLITPDVAQAFHEDGSRAFIQTPLKELPSDILSNIPKTLESIHVS